MATAKLLVFSIVLALICTRTIADSALKLELEQLKSKISILELDIEEKCRELKSKDDSIALLQSQIDLLQVHGIWLPPWFATHFVQCQTYVAKHWNQHGKPALDIMIQKALEKTAKAQKWATIHMETVRQEVIPAAKEQWVIFTTYIEPHMQSLTSKTVEIYESSKSIAKPHIIKVKELADPYLQETKNLSKPYIDHLVVVTKPYIDIARPYTEKVVFAYGWSLKTASTWHDRVQVTVKETLDKHEITRPLATKWLVWVVASASLALPVFFILRRFSAIFCKKSKKRVRTTHTKHGHGRRKHKHEKHNA